MTGARTGLLGKVTEPVREIDVVHATEVLVVGSGPAGLAAALAAARAGAVVSLLERFGCYGGNITAVGVQGMAWYRHEQTVDAGGLALEFETRAHERGAAVPESQSLSYEIDSEGFKLVADRLVEQAGVHGMLHRTCVAPLMDGATVVGVVTESKAGREAILARRVVDATGDADIAHRAGSPTRRTPREQMLAASVIFHLAGVDKQAFLAGVAADPQTYADWRGTGEWDIETTGRQDELFSPFLGKPFRRAVEDGVIPADLTTIAGTWGAVYDTGELTYLNLVHLDGIDGYGVLVLPTTGRYFQVPYRALLPRGIGGLLVAGRPIGGDRIAHAATRNMSCCAVTGQAAGIAAALSLHQNRDVAAVDLARVQHELERQGVRYT